MPKKKIIYFLLIVFIIYSTIYLVSFPPKLVTNLSLFSKPNEVIPTSISFPLKSVANLSLFSKPNEVNLTPTEAELSPDDFTKLINLDNFQFLRSVECTEDGKYPSLLIAVHSAPGHVENRQVIRETWGMQTPETRLIFMMGIPQKQDELGIIAAEHKKYKDIVQGNFMDSYKNLTYKHVMLLKYTIYHCPKIDYLLKTDDDVFINMPNVLSYIWEFNIAKPSELLYCLPMIGSPAIREKNKWQVTFEEFPDEIYPPYCSGLAELFTPDTVLRLYQAAQVSKFLWVDDAFVTGIAREAAKIKITPLHSSLFLKHNQMETVIKINNSYPDMVYPFLLGPLNINVENIRKLWNIVTYKI